MPIPFRLDLEFLSCFGIAADMLSTFAHFERVESDQGQGFLLLQRLGNGFIGSVRGSVVSALLKPNARSEDYIFH